MTTGDQIRVAHLVTGHAMYGAERWVQTLVRNTDAATVAPLVVTIGGTDGHRQVHAAYGANGVQTVHIPHGGKISIRALAAVADVMRQWGVEVLHTHGFKADVIGYLVRARVKRVSTLHGWTRGERWRVVAYEGLARRCLRRFDRVYPLSEWLEQDLVSRGFDPARVKLVRNAVDAAYFTEVYRARMQPGRPETGVVTFLGRIVRQKGVLDLVHAFAVSEVHSEARLLIVGDGPLKPEVMALCERLGLTGRVFFRSFVDDVRSVFLSSDVVVLPSYNEGIPRVLMEACAAGVPIVGSRIPGVRELIEHERTGLLVPVGDIAALARAMGRRYAERDLARSMARNARENVELRFAAPRQALEFLGEYRALVESRREHELRRAVPAEPAGEPIPSSVGR